MVEQYIYSRSENESVTKENKVSLGFGYVAWSPQMTDALKADAIEHSQEYLGGALRDAQNNPLVIYRKAQLEKSKKLLLQCCTPFRTVDEKGRTHRPFHVSHGFVLDGKDSYNPLSWFQLRYFQQNPNSVEGGVELADADSVAALPAEERVNFRPGKLASVMERLGITQQVFTQMVLACFDAWTSSRRVLIVYDDQDPNIDILKAHVLYWLYLCLPFALRRGVGADSEYTFRAAPQIIQVAFVPQRRVVKKGGSYMIALDEVVPLKGDYLIYKDTILHNSSYSSKWCGKNTLFARWITGVIDALWNQCDDAASLQGLVNALNAIYHVFDENLQRLGEDGHPSPELYNALCWMQLNRDSGDPLMNRVQQSIAVTEDEELTFQMTLMTRMPTGENVDVLLNRVLRRHVVPAGEEDLNLLVVALDSEARQRAVHILSAFMAADAMQAGKNILKVVYKYQQRLAGKGDAFQQVMTYFCFPDERYARDWYAVKMDPSVTGANQRRMSWRQASLMECHSLRELPDCIVAVNDSVPAWKNADPKILFQENIKLAEQILNQKYPRPTLSQVADLAKGIQPYADTEDRAEYLHLLCNMAGRSVPTPEQEDLETLEYLQQALLPMKNEAEICECWNRLLGSALTCIFRADQELVQDEKVLPRYRKLLRDIPLYNAVVEQQVLGRIYQEMLERPKPFMKADWLIRQLREDSRLNSTDCQALEILAGFAQSSSHTVRTWSGMKDRRNAEVAQKACGALPAFYMAGLLPDVSDIFLSYVVHLDLEKAVPVLRQAANFGGSKLIEDMLTVTKRYVRPLPGQNLNDLEKLLQSIANDEKILDTLGRQGKVEFELWLADSTLKWSKAGIISPDKARQVLTSLARHCEALNDSRTGNKIEKLIQKLN